MLRSFNTFFFAILGGFLVIHAQDQSGFISIDCGGMHSSRYTEKTTGLTYISDTDFIDTGESKLVSLEYRDKLQPYESLRSFPKGTRNCYKLNLTSNSKYLIRANFHFGNYDGQDKLPEFELHLGPNLWQSVTFQDASTSINYELIHVPLRDYVHVCLVNTGSGVPFISAIEIRPLPNSTFKDELVDGVSLALVSRLDTGQTAPLRGYRYPFDTLDRFWYGSIDWADWTQLTASSNIDTSGGYYKIPSIVMNTAATPKKETDSFINIWLPESDDENALYYIYLHFAEVEKLQSNQSRQFSLSMGGEFTSYTPVYGKSDFFKIENPLRREDINVSIIVAENSTLPPILNAFEAYMVTKFSGSETDEKDLAAITNIKSSYQIKRNWQGDPCTPTLYSWEGLNCTYPEGDASPRIISLYLAWSELQGEIDPSIFNLAMIQTLDLSNNNLTGPIPEFLSQLPNLVHLDLSNNNLTGQIPDIFTQLPKLTVLNLEKNNLEGSIPEGLIQRKNSGFLSLSLCENPNLHGAVSCKNKKNQNLLLLLAISIVGVSIIGIISAAIWWTFIRKRKHGHPTSAKDTVQLGTLESSKRKFAHSEIVKITNNFEWILGKGGFGTVYLGHLDDTQVAVKMLSPSSSQGFQQFHAEVNLLIKVHHKNLTSLVGYCNDETNLALVYEYMANGNLQEYLSDSSSHIFSWEGRLRIASEAAQGLEYLHYSIKPPMIHRDVKSANILLDEHFNAKVSDFGLSKNFPTEIGTHISTGPVGTPGYLDPEYFLSNKLNKTSDVFSFGIVLLEIITGRPVLSQTDDKRIHISQWVGIMLETGNIHSIVDPRLKGDFNINSVWKAVEIAMACASPNAINRPIMSQVVTELKECLATQMDEAKHNNELISNNSIAMLRPSVR